jgi:spectinomycin phosphotransferase
MLEKPNLPDAEITALLAERYGLSAPRPVFLPVGNDVGAWSYRIDTSAGQFFLKVRLGPGYEPALSVPRYLREQGIEPVIAPLPARGGVLRVRSGAYRLALYPYIQDARLPGGLTPEQWAVLGEAARRIHATRLPFAMLRQVRLDTFHPPWAAAVRAVYARMERRPFANAQQEAMEHFWRPRAAEIRRITARAAELGKMLRERAPTRVLCHGDLHTANLVIDDQGRVGIVDWDTLVFAPRERDLMFVVENGLPTGAEQHFFTGAGSQPGYGLVQLDALALAYYRYEWVVQELGDYGERIFPPENRPAPESVRAAAVEGMRALFDPGNVVESAYRSEIALSP